MKDLINKSLPIKTFLLIAILTLSEIASAQDGWIGIGKNFNMDDTTSSALIIESFRKGILLPRLSNQTINSLDMPPKGLFFYNTDQGMIQFNSGTSFVPEWVRLGAPELGWSLTGNAGTDYNNGDYLGTTDGVPFVLGISNDPIIFVTPVGVGIGISTNTPNQQLDVGGAINIGYSSTGSDGALRWSGSQFEGFNSQTGGWEPFGGGSDNDWTEGTGVVYNLSDQVGIGTATPANLLGVAGEVSIGSTYASQNSPPSNGLAVEGNVGIGHAGSSLVNLWVNSPSTNTTNFLGIYNTQAGDVGVFDGYAFYNSNNMTTTGTKFGISNIVNSTGTGERQGIFNQTDGNSSSSEIIYGYKGETNSAGSGASYSMYLDNVSGGSGVDYGVYTIGEDINFFEGKVGVGLEPDYKLHVESDQYIYTTFIQNIRASGGTAVRAITGNSGSPTTGTRYGVYAGGWYGQGTNYGVYGYGYSGNTTYGVYGLGQYGSTNYGVYGRAVGSNNFGVYGIAPSGYAIYSNGTQASTTSPYWTSVSDRKMKNNIQDLNINAMETILKFKTRTFMYKHEEYPHMDLPKGEQWGFIAQEVGEIIPEMERDITHPALLDEDGNELHPEVKLKGLNLDRLNPLFIKAFQEQQAMIEALQLKIYKLESQVAELSDK